MDFSREFWGLLGMFFEVASRFFEIPTFSKVLVVPKSSKISKIALLAAGLKEFLKEAARSAILAKSRDLGSTKNPEKARISKNW